MSDNKAMDMLEGHGLEKLAKSILDVLCDKYMTIEKLQYAVKEDRQMYDDNSEVNDFNIALMEMVMTQVFMLCGKNKIVNQKKMIM